MTIIDGVRAWLKTYEGLADGRLSVDFLPEEAKSYSVDTVPTTRRQLYSAVPLLRIKPRVLQR